MLRPQICSHLVTRCMQALRSKQLDLGDGVSSATCWLYNGGWNWHCPRFTFKMGVMLFSLAVKGLWAEAMKDEHERIKEERPATDK